ncbi:MAG: YbbR-like domain-containing protein [Bacteroidia bacterium]|nr:YbbR-like domain-containing protein [Bacteroidia bacterium]
MKTTLLNIIRKKGTNTNVRLNKRLSTFTVCLIIAVFFWILMSLSKDYSIIVNFPVRYIHLPQDKVVANHLPETIDMEINARGFDLLFYKLKQKKETVLIDVRDAKPLPAFNQYYLLTNSRIDKLTAQFGSYVKIKQVNPDTVYLNYNKKDVRSVPVKLKINLSFEPPYQQSDSISITPSFVQISGAADVVDKIHELYTQEIVLNGINKSQKIEIPIIITPNLKGVELSSEKIQVSIPVLKYTEATIDLPIETINLPEEYSLKTFPDKVQVKFNVAFDDYEKINQQQFKVVVDYKKIEQGSDKLKLNLVQYPSQIRGIKINPEKVEFIIRK